MSAVDPTYPLYPIACILSAVLLLLVLLTSFVRQSWNLGVAFLCFWLCLESLAGGINAIIWSHDAEIKLYAYCDIVSTLGLLCFVVKPMATLIIVRRLYLIASLRSVDGPSTAERRRNLVIEWILGLIIPIIIAGPVHYVVQGARFEVDAGFGCINSSSGSILTVLLVQSWGILPPLVSVIIYYPRVAWIFYRQHRDLNRFLRSNDSVTRTNYMRIFILTSIDILLTLPIGIATMVLFIATLAQEGKLQFYEGWSAVHADNSPISVPYPSSASERAQTYFEHWSSLALAFAIFGLFGLTREARESYWRFICAMRHVLKRKTKQDEHESDSTDTTLESEMEFGTQNEMISFDAERGRSPRFVSLSPRLALGEEAESKDEQVEAVQDITKLESSCQDWNDTGHSEDPASLPGRSKSTATRSH